MISNVWVKTFIVCMGAGIIYIFIDNLFALPENDLLTQGIAFGFSLFIVIISMMVSTQGYKQVRRSLR